MIDHRRAVVGDVGWGLFLASSWTWCIGMYLPVILLREWGWNGFALFALVNTIGAAAVGFLWTGPRSAVFTAQRRELLLCFSLATIAYQAFFIAWMGGASLQAPAAELFDGAGDGAAGANPMRPWWAWLLASGAIWMVTTLGGSGRGGWRTLGAIATLGSLLLWLVYGTAGWSRVGAGAAPRIDLAFVAPAIALGFIVCPHLDLTFHRVVRESGRRRPWIVFAFFFAPMLLFAASSYGPGGAVSDATLVAWWFVQASFTAAVHAREVVAAGIGRPRALVAVALATGAIAGSPLLGGESMYLRFLGLYGAVFPAMALLLWRGYRSLGILGYLAVAVPAFTAGFLGLPGDERGRMAWAVLLPMGLLLGMLLWPIKNGSVRSDRGSSPNDASTAPVQ